jgi:hypothetical protein
VRNILALMAALSPAFAAAPPATDRAALQGRWTVQSGRTRLGLFDGVLRIPASRLKPRLRVRGDEWEFSYAPPLAAEPAFTTRRWKVTLGAGGRGTVDLMGMDGPDRGKAHLGAYDLDGDSLRLSYAPAGKGRPAWPDPKAPGTTYLRLERAKE